MSGSKVIPTRHNRPDLLERKIKERGPGLVCIDSFYSANGAVADLPAYVDICERNDCVLLLDEAHSLGILGENGGGLAVSLGLADKVPFRTISFSKGLGGYGGAIACSEASAWWLTHRSSSVIFSSSVMPAESAANAAALEVVMEQPELGATCLKRADQLRSLLRARGIETGPAGSQIVSIELPTGDASTLFYHAMKDKGVLTSVFLYPAVALGTGLVRLSVYATLTPEDVVYVADCAAKSMQEIKQATQAVSPQKASA